MKNLHIRHVYLLVIMGCFSVILVQLFLHQVVHGAIHNEISRRNYVRIVRVNPLRGMILDERLRPIVANRPAVNLYFKPFLVNDKQSFIQFVTSHLDIQPDYLEKLIYDNRFRKFEEVLIAEDLQENVMANIAEEMNYHPEFILKPESVRLYNIPNHFTGYVRKIDEQEYQRFRTEDYTLNSIIGKNGIERSYEGILSGKSGYEIMQVDAKGRSYNFFRQDLSQKPVNGFNVVLTINLDLQEHIRNVFPSDKSGAVVVMNPKTGGILSYNSFPEYDQNWFSTGISSAQWDFLNEHENKPMIDRVVNGTYPPGSTFKVLSAAYGLEKNYINESTRMTNCTGGMQFGDRFYKCWNSRGHGRLNINGAMVHSCDVFFYDLSQRFNLDEFFEFAHLNHLFARTGIDLPSERAGLFPNSDWYRNRLGRYFSVAGIKANLVIGQGEVLVSPLAMCTYYSAIANDGLWQTPHLFQRAFTDNSVITRDLYPRTKKYLPHSDETLKIIQKALYDIVNSNVGTGRNARVPGVEVYGKTGSSENHQGGLTHASYAGYAKWNGEVELAFYVMVENSGGGGAIAAPIAREIIQYYNENLRN